MLSAAAWLRHPQGCLNAISALLNSRSLASLRCSSVTANRNASSLACPVLISKSDCQPAGFVHCKEALSTSDGPGLRYVVYLSSTSRQLCAGASQVASQEIAQDLQRYVPFLTPTGGGITCSGASPLQQPEFCASLFYNAHKLDVTTCLLTTAADTPSSAYEHVLPHTDSVILQVNNLSASKPTHLAPSYDLDSRALSNCVQQLHAYQIPYHIRYLLIPGVTDQPGDIRGLLEFAKEQGPLLQGIQVMPYHQLGGEKWEALGLSRTLRGLKPFKLEDAVQLVNEFDQQGINAALA